MYVYVFSERIFILFYLLSFEILNHFFFPFLLSRRIGYFLDFPKNGRSTLKSIILTIRQLLIKYFTLNLEIESSIKNKFFLLVILILIDVQYYL